MATGAIIVLVIVIVLLLAAGLAGTLLLRRRRLRQRFGPEYDQLASEVGERQAQAELSERERRVAQLDIHPLSPERRAGYDREWRTAEEKFVDSPAQSVEAAGMLVPAVAADRGYSADDEDRLLDDLSVHHADRIEGYRQARTITRQAGRTGTEELRQALLSYRALFRDLVGSEPADGQEADAAAEPAASDRADDGSPADGDGTETGTTAVGDGTGGETTAGDDGAWVDSGRDNPATAPAARKE